MFMIAGLLGLMAVGATAFFGFDFGPEDDQDASLWPPETVHAGGQKTDLLDSIPDEAGDEAEPASGDESEGDGAGKATEDIAAALAEEPGDATGGEDLAVLQPGAQPGEIAWGDEADDTLAGGEGDDQINGYGGDDLVEGGAGDDQLYGQDGQDTVLGGEGDDTLHGEAGDDALAGEGGQDALYGHGGQDTMSGGTDDDTLHGGEDDDLLMGDEGKDALHGGLDDDTLIGGLGQDTLFGGPGSDAIIGVSEGFGAPDFEDLDGRDYLNGGDDDDTILIGKDDIATGSAGADSFVLGDWITQEHQAEITDFSAAEDALMVIYDDSTDPDPELAIEPDEEDADVQHLVLNGERIAMLTGAAGLTLNDITLIPESALPHAPVI